MLRTAPISSRSSKSARADEVDKPNRCDRPGVIDLPSFRESHPPIVAVRKLIFFINPDNGYPSLTKPIP